VSVLALEIQEHMDLLLYLLHLRPFLMFEFHLLHYLNLDLIVTFDNKSYLFVVLVVLYSNLIFRIPLNKNS
jgi:hypothetical protein